jgi:hypothetical protein
MARDEQDTPSIQDPYLAEVNSPRLSDRVARVGVGAEHPELTGPGDPGQSVIFQHLHEGRVIRSAGRMVLGARAPLPVSDPAGEIRDSFEHSQLFSSSREGRPRSLSGGAAVALACAVAVGSTAVLTSALNTSIERDNTGKNAGRNAGAEVAPASRAVMAASSPAHPQATTQVASVSPVAIAQAITAGPGVVRMVKQDAPGLVVEDISGQPGSEIPLRIEIAQSDTEEYSFLMFRGLPAEISLSAGFRLKDSWAVSLRDLANLALVSPPNFESRFQIEVLLIKGRNTPADSRVMSVTLQRSPSAAPPAVASAARQEAASQRILTAAPPEAVEPEPRVEPAPPSIAPAQTKKLTISPETENAMLDRATEMLSLGDVSSARLLFEHLAKKGSGRAAMSLARTYDPAFFGSINTRGLKPDPAKAKQWYTTAAELGQDEARSRLSALSR